MNGFAQALSTQQADEMSARLTSGVTRSIVGGYSCYTGKLAVMAYYQRTQLDNFTRLRYRGLDSDDVKLLGGGAARAKVPAVINDDPAQTFTYTLTHVGNSWKIADIKGPGCYG